MLNLHTTPAGSRIEGDRYTVRWAPSDPARLHIDVEGSPLLRPVLLGGLDRIEGTEELTNLQVDPPRREDEEIVLTATADSNLWSDRTFSWTFHPDRIEHTHSARGKGRLDRCYYLGHAKPGAPAGTRAVAEHLYSPQHNMASRNLSSSAEPASVHATNDTVLRTITPLFNEYPFCPPPLFMAFCRTERDLCLGVGLGAEAGSAHYNGLLWSGDADHGMGWFSLEYYGYQEVDGLFTAPRLVFQPGYHAQEVMRDYIRWTEEHGFCTEQQHATAPWHRQPIFCGWNEQIYVSRRLGCHPRDMAAQEHYENWIARVEELGLPAGTIVIDDKWMAHYGRWDIDTEKWPDLPGFIARQHDAGRRVLLWIACWHQEGLPGEWCVTDDGEPVQADPTHPEYQAFIRERVTDLVGHTDADGFKLDWVFPLLKKPDYGMHTPSWGIERLYRHQKLIYDAAHAAKPDALVQTHTPNPLFRDCSDMIRLNDLTNSQRRVTETMRDRARIARIAGWDLIDCDNASSAGLAEWRHYMHHQPTIGVPSLYCLSGTDHGEEIPEEDWPLIRHIWLDYVRDLIAEE